jgi:hypothetical protein
VVLLREPDFMLRAYLELLRIPNVFTAVSNVWVGYLLTHPSLDPWADALLLTVSSILLYLAGMVLNDVFDVEIDRRERPERPIPSGRVNRSTAMVLGYSLLLGGVAAGWGATAVSGNPRCGVTASILALAIWMYDAWSKHTPLGPLGMGLCRALNVMLGMSTAAVLLPMHYGVAAGIGIYAAGITWMAWNEATTSRAPPLALANITMIAGLTLLAWYPQFNPGEAPFAQQLGAGHRILCGAAGAGGGRRPLTTHDSDGRSSGDSQHDYHRRRHLLRHARPPLVVRHSGAACPHGRPPPRVLCDVTKT